MKTDSEREQERKRQRELNRACAEITRPPGFHVTREHARVFVADAWTDCNPDDGRRAIVGSAECTAAYQGASDIPFEGDSGDEARGLPHTIAGNNRAFRRKLHAIGLWLEANDPKAAEEIANYRGPAPNYVGDWGAAMSLRDFAVARGVWHLFDGHLGFVVAERVGCVGASHWKDATSEDLVYAFLRTFQRANTSGGVAVLHGFEAGIQSLRDRETGAVSVSFYHLGNGANYQRLPRPPCGVCSLPYSEHAEAFDQPTPAHVNNCAEKNGQPAETCGMCPDNKCHGPHKYVPKAAQVGDNREPSYGQYGPMDLDRAVRRMIRSTEEATPVASPPPLSEDQQAIVDKVAGWLGADEPGSPYTRDDIAGVAKRTGALPGALKPK